MALTYLITGASRGIGLELATLLLNQPSEPIVVAGVRTPQTASALQTLVSHYPGRLHVIKLDTADEKSIKAAAQWVDENLGGRLDVLINNAGVGEPPRPWTSATSDDFSYLLKVNTIGPLLLSAALLPALKRGDKKVIANISSGAGSFSMAYDGMKHILDPESVKDASSLSNPFATAMVTYRATKAALNMEMLMVAGDLASEGFTVVNIHPGIVATDMATDSLDYLSNTMDVKSLPLITTTESATGLLSVLNHLSPRDNGEFYNYDGSKLPW